MIASVSGRPLAARRSPRILTLGYLSRASVRNLGPEPSESAFTPGGAASVRKLGAREPPEAGRRRLEEAGAL